jgi:hypothetical protein
MPTLTPRATVVQALARREAELLDQPPASGHVLLALVWEGGGLAARALAGAGLSEGADEEIRTRLAAAAESERGTSAVELQRTAARIAAGLGHDHLGTEHQLLALIDDATLGETILPAGVRQRAGARLRENVPAPTIRDSETARVGETVEGPLQLPIETGRVEQCCLDNAFTLLVEVSAQWWNLRIEGSFALVSEAQPLMSFKDEKAPPSSWGPAVDVLLHNTVTEAHVASGGTLSLVFADGYRLDVPPSPQWEAWQLSGPQEQFIVCGPDGQLSRWPVQAD